MRNRRKLIALSLTLTSVVWSLDMLSGGGTPESAVGATAHDAVTAPPLAVDAPDRAELETFLFAEPTPVAPANLDSVRRDPFQMPEEFRTMIDPPAPPVAIPAVADAATTDPEPTPPFESLHRLDGVLAGTRPLALVDGKILRAGDRLDGYRLMSIERDSVVFQRGSVRVVLQIPRPEKR